MLRQPRTSRAFPFLLAIAVIAVVIGLQALVTPGFAQTFTPGTQARVAGDGDCLRLRSAPSVDGTIITCLPDGSIVNIREGSTFADGFTWQFVEGAGAIGWVAADFLEPLGATPSPTPSVTTTPSPTPSPAPTPSPPASSGQGAITGTLPPSGKIGLIVWSGGAVDSLVATAAAQGCALRSVFAARGGELIGYTVGAPAFVNATWNARVGSTLPPTSALIVICSSPAQASTGSPSGPAAGSTSPPSSDDRPPGPGGN